MYSSSPHLLCCSLGFLRQRKGRLTMLPSKSLSSLRPEPEALPVVLWMGLSSSQPDQLLPPPTLLFQRLLLLRMLSLPHRSLKCQCSPVVSNMEIYARHTLPQDIGMCLPSTCHLTTSIYIALFMVSLGFISNIPSYLGFSDLYHFSGSPCLCHSSSSLGSFSL